MARTRPTIADLQAMKGKKQYVMLRVETLEEAEAAERAGIDMASIPPEMMLDPEFRDAAPGLFAMPGLNFYDVGGPNEFMKWAFPLYKAGADALYCSGSFETVRRLAAEGFPIVGHTGLIPSKRTWTGGFKAVGKTAATAIKIMQDVRRYEAVGAFGAEIEVVPHAIAAEISKRTPLFMISMGAGTGGDAQYLFATDVLGSNTGHIPRHAKVYRNFAAEHARLQQERVAAFSEFAADVTSGAYPAPEHLVEVEQTEFDQFMAQIDKI